MSFQEQDVEALATIGLTKTEAKVYLTLAKLGKAKARTIWKNSGVARQDIYRILTELQRNGLVEKIIAVPTEYKATPLQDGLSFLLKRKAHEYKEIEKKTKELLDRLRTRHQEKTAKEEYEFTLITGKEANIRRLQEGVINAKNSSVEVIDSWQSFKYALVVNGEDMMNDAKRKVMSRFITDKPEDGETVPKIIQTLKKTGYFKLRHLPTRPPASIRIEDGKRISLCTTTKARFTPEAPSLYSDNPCLLALLQDYFELLWNSAKKHQG